MLQHQLPQGSQSFSLSQKLQWLTKPLEVLETQAQIYGDTFTIPGLRGMSQVVITNPQDIQKFFTADPQQLDSGEEAGVKLPLLGQNSMLALSGDRHRRQRKLLMPPFHGERMRAYGKLISEIAEEVTSKWKSDETFSIRSSMQTISFEVIIKAVFGLEEGLRSQQLKAVLLEWLNPQRPLLQTLMLMFPTLQRDLGAWSPWGHFLILRQRMDKLIYAEIAERRKSELSGTDILSLMMAARDENGEQMTDVELRDELMTLLVAGHETTATSLAWAFYWIHHQPQIRDKVLQELNSLGEDRDFNRVLKLPYLNAVCKETLRIYPVTMFSLPRVVKRPLQIAEYQLEPGTILSASIYLTHHRQDLYPEPKQFKPERFLDDGAYAPSSAKQTEEASPLVSLAPDGERGLRPSVPKGLCPDRGCGSHRFLERQFSPYEYLPFGGGNRRCLGYAFAEFEMKIVLANILSRWQLELPDSELVKPVRKGMLIAPSDGVRMVAKNQRVLQDHHS